MDMDCGRTQAHAPHKWTDFYNTDAKGKPHEYQCPGSSGTEDSSSTHYPENDSK